MATFAALTGIPTPSRPEFEQWTRDPVRWPAGYFYDDPRMVRTDPHWQDYRGKMTFQELREFRGKYGLAGRDHELDAILNSSWDGIVAIRCGEWES